MYSHCNFNCQLVTGLDAACNAAGRTLKVEFMGTLPSFLNESGARIKENGVTAS